MLPPPTAPPVSGASSAPRLVRVLGRWTLTALVINAIIGSGIFGLPAVLAQLLGPHAVWAWVIGAIGNGVVMACFAEVASRFTAAGGAYLYARASLPRLVAIQVGWLAFLTRLSAAAAGANLFTVNLGEFFPAAEREATRIAMLVGLIGVLAAINVRGVAAGARISNVFTAGKLIPLALLLAAGTWFVLTRDSVAALLPAVSADPLLANTATTQPSVADWLRAVLLVAFAYGGYDGAMMAMGEAKNPRRDAPFALITAMIFLVALYTAVQLVVDATLADPAASERPLAAAARVIMGPIGGYILACGALISIVGFLGANFLNAPRLSFALAERRDLPALFGRVHPRFHTPYLSILIFAVLVLALAIYGNFAWNATLSAVARLFVYGSTCAALLVLRRRDPNGGELRLPGGVLLPVLGIGFCALLAARMGGAELVILGVIFAVALAHWAWVRRQAEPPITTAL